MFPVVSPSLLPLSQRSVGTACDECAPRTSKLHFPNPKNIKADKFQILPATDPHSPPTTKKKKEKTFTRKSLAVSAHQKREAMRPFSKPGYACVRVRQDWPTQVFDYRAVPQHRAKEMTTTTPAHFTPKQPWHDGMDHSGERLLRFVLSPLFTNRSTRGGAREERSEEGSCSCIQEEEVHQRDAKK